MVRMAAQGRFQVFSPFLRGRKIKRGLDIWVKFKYQPDDSWLLDAEGMGLSISSTLLHW